MAAIHNAPVYLHLEDGDLLLFEDGAPIIIDFVVVQSGSVTSPGLAASVTGPPGSATVEGPPGVATVSGPGPDGKITGPDQDGTIEGR